MPKASWKRARVVIDLNANRATMDDDGTRDAWTSDSAPGLCVLKERADGSGRWNVTHVPSGKAVVPSIRTLRAARVAALMLARIIDCTVDGATLAGSVNDENRAAVFQVRRDAWNA